MSHPILDVRDLSKSYGAYTVLSHVSFTVNPGEALALVGRNGAGKSTLLRCLVGIDKPSQGQVLFNGEVVKETNPRQRAQIATVIDDLDFFPDLSVVEHLDLISRAHGVPDAQERVDAVITELGLVGQSGQLPGTLSSGQRRKLALATAFVRPKRLLVLDEPEQRLDVQTVEWLGRKLSEEISAGVAVVCASHDPALVDALGARILEIGCQHEARFDG